jgi:hypothetical protein
MAANSGLLTARCDPFGAESRIQLMGGMYPEANLGRMMWHCDQRAEARYRYVCTGGTYGLKPTPGHGIVNPFHCGGGHRGQVMPLCRKCARDMAAGPPKPGYARDGTPVGQIGGTVSNEMCPRCMWPGDAAQLHHLIEATQANLAACVLADQRRAMVARIEGMRARMDELHLTGKIHKCPLMLVEVS